MPDQSAEYREAFSRFLEFHEAYISTHIAKIKRENSPQKQSVRSVISLWNRLDQPPLRPLTARRMVDLLREALSSGQMRCATEVVNDCCLIVTVVPAYHAPDVRDYFGPDGYAHFTMVEAGGAEAASQGRWVAHWTLCTDGSRSPIVHLTVLPSGEMLEAGPALMLWAQDLFTKEEWQRLPAFMERFFSGGKDESPDEGISILDLAKQAAEHPEAWDKVVSIIRSPAAKASLASSEQLGSLKVLVNGHKLLNNPEPLGFLAAALCYELVQAIEEPDAGFVREVGLWAAAHPCHAAQFIPIRIHVHETLLASFDRSGNPHFWAGLQQALGNDLIYSLKGDRWENLGKAIRCYHAALQVFTLDNAPVPWAMTQHSLGHAYLECAEGASYREIDLAIRCFKDSLKVWTRASMPTEWADSTLGLGACFRKRVEGKRTDNQERALQYHLAALGVYSLEETPTRWATAQDSLGTLYCDRINGDRAENLEEAIRCYQEALKGRRKEVTPVEWAMTMNNLGTAHDDRIRGDRAENQEEAIRCYRAALSVRGEFASARQWGIRRHNLGSAFLDRIRGDQAENIEEAINCYEAALTVRTRQVTPVEWAMTQSDLGYAYTRRSRGKQSENLEKAIVHLKAALGVRSRETMPAEWARTRNNLGNAYRDRSVGDRAENQATAVECYQEAAETFEQLGIRREAVRSYRNLGRVEIERKNWVVACRSLEKAAELLEGELAESHTEVGRLSWLREESGVYDALVATYLLAHQAGQPSLGPGPTNVARACYWAERSRARFLADLMAAAERVPQGVAEETYGHYCSTMHRVRDLDRKLEALERKRAGLGNAIPQRRQVEQNIAAYQAHRSEAYGRVLSFRDQFAKSDLDWVAGAKSLSAEAMLKVARDSNSALLTLRPTEWGTCVVLVRPDGKVAGGVLKSLPVSRVQELLARQDGGTTAGGWIVEYERYCTASDTEYEDCRRGWHQELDRTLGRLGEWLWQPLRRWLEKVYPRSDDPAHPKPLIIMPGQGLNILPIHACWWQEGPNRCWASDEYQISYVPSIWVLRRCLARQAGFASCPQELLAVRNPTGDLDWANWEADGVCRLFPYPTVLGSQTDRHPATQERLKKELPRFSLALLCTHGIYEIADPWTRTGLCTADAKKDDPRQPCLTLADIFEMKLSKLWLAVLSACESGFADYRDPAGEQMGLPSALLAAGAITAVGSLWVVDDLATALLSRRFFQELFAHRDGEPVTKGLALWRAQQWLRNLTAEELFGITGTLPDSERSLVERHLRTTRDMVRVPHKGTSVLTGRPYEHPVYWSAFACYGAS